MGIDQLKIIRTLRLILTCLVLFLATWYYQVPERIWSLITVWFVMTEYTNVGGVFRKSLYRFSGTCLSAAYGLLIIYCFENNVVINMVAFVAGVFVYMYYFLDGDKTYIAVIGSVTLSIVLLNHNDLDAAILRTFNIIIGILASMFMIRFFYPVYAKDEVIDAQVNFIKQLSGIVIAYLDPSRSLASMQAECLKYENQLVAGLASFSRHLSEATIETRHMPEFITYNRAASEHIRRLFRLLTVFVNDFTTDDMRLNPWVCESLNQVLLDFGAIQSKLEQDDNDMEQPVVSKLADIGIVHKGVPIPAIHILFTAIKKEVTCLDEEIEKIASIYNEYNTRKSGRYDN